nr:hypothetical protein [Tanacetum cinerariifolium]
MNEDTLVVVATIAPMTATTPVVDMTVETKKCNTVDDTTVEKEKLSSLEDIIAMGSFPPLPTHVTTSAGNAPDAILENGPRVMIELRADVEPKDNIILAMPKITRKGHYTYNVHAKYEWKPPRCSSCKVFRHIHEECSKNIGAREKKTVKKPSQTSRGVSVGLKTGFKPQKVYRPVPKKSTTSSSGNKKKCVEPTLEVCNSNQFDVLNLVDNDVEFGTNRGTNNLVDNGATSSGSFFTNVDNSSSGTTPIIDKIEKFEDLLTSGQAILVDQAVNPLKKVEIPGEYDEDEVASIDNDMARSMASEMVGLALKVC